MTYVRQHRLNPSSGTVMAKNSYSILYIEDNEANRQLIGLILQHKKYLTYSSAEDGESGIKKAMNLLPDIILLDISLPDMDGHEVLARLRQEPLTADIPVIAISGDFPLIYPDDAEYIFDNFIAKPVSIEPFFQTIDTLIDLRLK